MVTTSDYHWHRPRRARNLRLRILLGSQASRKLSVRLSALRAIALVKNDGRPIPPHALERLSEPVLQEFAQFGRCLELRDRFQLLERRGERVGKTPNGPGPKLLILWLEIQVMHRAGQMFGSLELALNERLVDDHFGGDVGQLTSLPGLHLLSHRLEISLHSIYADRDAVDERERLRMFCEHWREVPRERHVRADEHAIATGHRQTHALVMGIPQTDGEAASFHLGCEIQNAERLHAVR